MQTYELDFLLTVTLEPRAESDVCLCPFFAPLSLKISFLIFSKFRVSLTISMNMPVKY